MRTTQSYSPTPKGDMPEETLSHGGKTYVLAEAPRGKKSEQVAGMITYLQEHPGEPVEFDALCSAVGQKYPQDVQAAMIALEMVEHVDRYNDSREVGHRAKSYYVWSGSPNPTPGSVPS